MLFTRSFRILANRLSCVWYVSDFESINVLSDIFFLPEELESYFYVSLNTEESVFFVIREIFNGLIYILVEGNRYKPVGRLFL